MKKLNINKQYFGKTGEVTIYPNQIDEYATLEIATNPKYYTGVSKDPKYLYISTHVIKQNIATDNFQPSVTKNNNLCYKVPVSYFSQGIDIPEKTEVISRVEVMESIDNKDLLEKMLIASAPVIAEHCLTTDENILETFKKLIKEL